MILMNGNHFKDSLFINNTFNKSKSLITLWGLDIVVEDCIIRKGPWEYKIAESSGLQAAASTG